MSANTPLEALLPAKDRRELDAYYYSSKRIYLIPKEGGG